MSAGGGRGRTEEQRAQWAACYADGLASRRAAKAAGMTAARKWREEHRPVAAEGHMPFPGHRNCAGETWCTECKQLRAVPCSYALCALQARA